MLTRTAYNYRQMNDAATLASFTIFSLDADLRPETPANMKLVSVDIEHLKHNLFIHDFTPFHKVIGGVELPYDKVDSGTIEKCYTTAELYERAAAYMQKQSEVEQYTLNSPNLYTTDTLFALKAIQAGNRPSPLCCIQDNLEEITELSYSAGIKQILHKYWDKVSDDSMHPVPSTIKGMNAIQAYAHIRSSEPDSLWNKSHEYGALRHEALQVLIDHATELTLLRQLPPAYEDLDF